VTRSQVKRAAQDIARWLRSKEGKAALRDAQRVIERASQELAKTRQIDTLNEPMTV
jgi:hypothetical protein